MRANRGAVLGIVIITTLLCSIAAYTVLMVAISQAQQSVFLRDRTEARYYAEAAIVSAMQKLWNNPAYCSGNETINTPGGPVMVAVTCNVGPPKRITATVNF